MSDLAEFLDDALRPDGAPHDYNLDRHLEQDADAVEHTPWQIHDEGVADWAARKVQRARADIAAKQAQRDLLVQQADEWLAQETGPLEHRARFFEGRLGDWLRREIEADDSKMPKVSRVLPCGATVRRTPAGESLVVDDEETLVRFLAENEDTAELVEFVPKYSKADVKKLVTKVGLAVPGVHIEQGVHGWKVD